MRRISNLDKIIKFTIIAIVVLCGVIYISSLILANSQDSVINNNTIILNLCGYTKEKSLQLFNGNLIHNKMFVFPYDTSDIRADEYFSLVRNNRTGPVFNSNSEPTFVYKQYYLKTISEGNQSNYYSTILKRFQTVKKQYYLDDDQYLQLIVNYVQALPYYTNNSKVKYPLVTLIDSCGDCDDKSLLLVSLLSKEGYNVSIFIIPPEAPYFINHAMAGIASNSSTFTKNGYAMIETTRTDSPIGEFPDTLNGKFIQVVKIGNGTKTYETHSMISINNNRMYRVIKKGERIISITPYSQIFNPLDFFRNHEENLNWENDCKMGRIPYIPCNFS